MSEKYDRIGQDYNATRKADKYIVNRLNHHLAPVQYGEYLDIGCGTGNYTVALNKKGIIFIGVDPSNKMLREAKSKNSSVTWKKGTAENIPLPDQCVDGIIASLTIHHWSDLKKSFLELYRVLKPNGKLIIFTSTPDQMKGYWLNHYFSKMMADSIAQMPSFNLVVDSIFTGGFELTETENYFIHPELEDHFLYAGKHEPNLYLNDQIRKGISSFSALANIEEINVGLIKLQRDINSGAINKIMDKYKNTHGDYLFITITKPSTNNQQ